MKRAERVMVAALVIAIGAGVANAGMARPLDPPTLLERDAYFVGTYTDWRGMRGSFFVDVKTLELIGPFDHYLPTGKAHGTPAEPSPPAPTVAAGTRGRLKFWWTVPNAVFGGRPTPQQPIVQRIGPRSASDPDTDLDGTFVAFAAAGRTLTVAELLAKQPDSMLLGFFGATTKSQVWALTDGMLMRRALRGLLLSGQNDLAHAYVREKLQNAPRTAQNDVLPAFGLLFDGLAGLVAAPPCVNTAKEPYRCHPLYPLVPAARAWLEHRPDEAKRFFKEVVAMPCCFALPWEPRPMMEDAAPPFAGQFVRGDFLGRDYAEILKARAPEFTAALLTAYHEHLATLRH